MGIRDRGDNCILERIKLHVRRYGTHDVISSVPTKRDIWDGMWPWIPVLQECGFNVFAKVHTQTSLEVPWTER